MIAKRGPKKRDWRFDVFYLRILHIKHRGISVFVAREGHCKLSELRRSSEVENKRVLLRSDSEERVSRLPKPTAGESSVGWSRLSSHSQSCQRGASVSVQCWGPVTDQITEDKEAKPCYVDMELVQRNSMDSSC